MSDKVANLGAAAPWAAIGISLTDIDLLLRIVLSLVGIAAGVASYLYYRSKTK